MSEIHCGDIRGTTVLAAYFDRVRRRLQAEGDAARSFQHALNRGQIREAFVREFLAQNISDFWGIGTGEIIHSDSSPDEPRRQIDVVVHSRKYPRLSLATGIDLFFVETVSSFIEIKSSLTKSALREAAAVTKEIKSNAHFPPQRLNPAGMVETPRPYSFVFGYDGPKRMETVLNWLKDISQEDDYGVEALSEAEPDERFFFNHHFIDGVFLLGRGYVTLDALPFQSYVGQSIEMGVPASPRAVWIWSRQNELLMLWALINQVNARLLWGEADLTSYIGSMEGFLNE